VAANGAALLLLLTALTLSPSPVNFPRYPALDFVLLLVTNTKRFPCTYRQHTAAQAQALEAAGPIVWSCL
jgi:hypothetical protein